MEGTFEELGRDSAASVGCEFDAWHFLSFV